MTNTPKPSKTETNTLSREIVWQGRKHWLWFGATFTKYTLYKDRLIVDKGLLNTVSDQTLLYRITDIRLRRSLAQKIFGTGNVILISKVDSDHELVLQNVKNSKNLTQMISDLVEQNRSSRNVIGKEFYSDGCGLEHEHGDSI